ncbi:MAG: N-acetylmuramic acid 6-phosphate etherase [Chroococcopsis gigantea SAG 12.99]|jgi:N-acetylmuramic acid 6-phosphate etherase|nr:N-acetylmuramic acid 6-phosphate etherase [Chlorogloea purpurea SAG 13.99]MDV2999750.1 N-acetylmuramic acid 6-phosphate etherase [Chroococcopsis gigantea SAG 12.99]
MEQLQSRGHLLTEQINPNSQNLDALNSLELVQLFNQEDARTLDAIANAAPEIARTIDAAAHSLRGGGRLFYVGAGTSGRLGVLDAAECPPTFCTPPELVQAIIAGGASALVRSSESLEDNAIDGARAIMDREITSLDVVIGITAGGTTPYVHGALKSAKERGAITVGISCVTSQQVPLDVDIDIRLLTGPEIVAGSTRLKAGTVTKMALNIISTGTMVKLGKVYGNRMIDVAVTNQKLHDRALRIISDITGLDRAAAELLLEKSGKKVKLALLMHWSGLTPEEGEKLLHYHQGNLRSALKALS